MLKLQLKLQSDLIETNYEVTKRRVSGQKIPSTREGTMLHSSLFHQATSLANLSVYLYMWLWVSLNAPANKTNQLLLLVTVSYCNAIMKNEGTRNWTLKYYLSQERFKPL